MSIWQYAEKLATSFRQLTALKNYTTYRNSKTSHNIYNFLKKE